MRTMAQVLELRLAPYVRVLSSRSVCLQAKGNLYRFVDLPTGSIEAVLDSMRGKKASTAEPGSLAR